ncbi:MAG: cbb3-type cytochrome c oxidase subunit I, partial [Rhodospirillaceae bacterium]
MSAIVSAPRPVEYAEDTIRYFTLAAVFWAIIGMAMGLYIASELAFPALNLGLEWTSFGRLRPVHTSAVVFAFGGNVLFATSFYCVQRTCRARAWGGESGLKFLFWGYQIFILLAASGYVMGITQGKEYAEPEWYTDLWLTVVWVAYIAIFVGTIARRQEPHIYVANWFFLGFMVTVAILHLGNNINVPVSFFGWKSYTVVSGVQSAMVQWWYGHNAVGF